MSGPSPLVAALFERFGEDRVRVDAALAPFTTFKVGGPADALVETRKRGTSVECRSHEGSHADFRDIVSH